MEKEELNCTNSYYIEFFIIVKLGGLIHPLDFIQFPYYNTIIEKKGDGKTICLLFAKIKIMSR